MAKGHNCETCMSGSLPYIDADLQRLSADRVAKKYGLSPNSVRRHRENHLERGNPRMNIQPRGSAR
jgi:hypothetical protein